jgi:uncharacterized repeat protein (TIGR04076 family)
MNRVRITVLKREFYPDLAEQYLSEGVEAGSCPLHTVGDTYVYEGGAEKPEGLCPWAWIDLYAAVSTLFSGGDENTWFRDGGTRIRCCTDGVRPVVFKLELLREE